MTNLDIFWIVINIVGIIIILLMLSETPAYDMRVRQQLIGSIALLCVALVVQLWAYSQRPAPTTVLRDTDTLIVATVHPLPTATPGPVSGPSTGLHEVIIAVIAGSTAQVQHADRYVEVIDVNGLPPLSQGQRICLRFTEQRGQPGYRKPQVMGPRCPQAGD